MAFVEEIDLQIVEHNPISAFEVDPNNREQVGSLIGVMMCALAIYEQKTGTELPIAMQHSLSQLEEAQKFLEGENPIPRIAFDIVQFQAVHNMGKALDEEVLTPFVELHNQQTLNHVTAY